MKSKWKVVSALFLMLTLFTACSNKPVNNDEFSQAIGSLISEKPTDNIVFVTNQGSFIDNTIVSGSMAATITSKIEYSIKSVKSSNEKNIAEVTFTYPDMVDITNQYISTNTEEDLFSWLTTKLDNDYPQKQETVEVELTQYNDKCCLIIDEKLSNILTGGLLEYKISTEKDAFTKIMGE